MQESVKMVKQKVRLPRLATFFLCFLLIVFLIISPTRLIPLLQTDLIQNEIDTRRTNTFHGVITLWQIDAFEGGTGSRTAWLNQNMIDFEKQYNGVYVVVRSLTPERAALLLAQGDPAVLPDMISFGAGVTGIEPSLFLKPDDALLMTLRPDLINSADGYCVPWCMGGYAVLMDTKEYQSCVNAQTPIYAALGKTGKVKATKKGEKTVYALGIPNKAGYLPEAALALTYEKNASAMLEDQYALRKNANDTGETLFEAYNYAYSVNALLGTQRDIYRIITAEKANKARETTVLPLTGYTDLVQYIGIVKCDNQQKIKVMENFIGFLLQVSRQECLSEIGLFPVIAGANPIYDDARVQELFSAMQKKQMVIPSPFKTEKEKIENMQMVSAYLAKGSDWEQAKNNLNCP